MESSMDDLNTGEALVAWIAVIAFVGLIVLIAKVLDDR